MVLSSTGGAQTDWEERRLLVATPVAILGGALQAGAVNITMFLVGRTFGDFAAGTFVCLIPLFQSEIAAA